MAIFEIAKDGFLSKNFFREIDLFDFMSFFGLGRIHLVHLQIDDWKVTDDSSVNFHDVFFFIFCYNLSKNEEKHIIEIYG